MVNKDEYNRLNCVLREHETARCPLSERYGIALTVYLSHAGVSGLGWLQ